VFQKPHSEIDRRKDVEKQQVFGLTTEFNHFASLPFSSRWCLCFLSFARQNQKKKDKKELNNWEIFPSLLFPPSRVKSSRCFSSWSRHFYTSSFPASPKGVRHDSVLLMDEVIWSCVLCISSIYYSWLGPCFLFCFVLFYFAGRTACVGSPLPSFALLPDQLTTIQRERREWERVHYAPTTIYNPSGANGVSLSLSPVFSGLLCIFFSPTDNDDDDDNNNLLWFPSYRHPFKRCRLTPISRLSSPLLSSPQRTSKSD